MSVQLKNDASTSCQPAPTKPGRGAVTLFTLAGLQFISLVDFMIVMPLGPQLQIDLGINARQFGWIVSSYTLAAGATLASVTRTLKRSGGSDFVQHRGF